MGRVDDFQMQKKTNATVGKGIVYRNSGRTTAVTRNAACPDPEKEQKNAVAKDTRAPKAGKLATQKT